MESGSESKSGFEKWSFDLFVSFFGNDLRKQFIKNLFNALDKTGSCRIYRDGSTLERTCDIPLSLIEAISKTRLSIIAFSAHYVESAWCLEELLHILKCRDTNGLKVFPIFYDINTDHVHGLTGTYAYAFDKHEKEHGKVKADAWREAVKKAAAISGIDCGERSQEEFIEEIVALVVAIIKRKSLVIDQPLVKSRSRIEKVDKLVDKYMNDARMIVIWGDDGFGKTTIAKLIYNSILSKFDYFCFLQDVGIKHKSQEDSNRGLKTLQKEILSTLLVPTRFSEGEGIREGKRLIRNTCLNKKVLIVLDGVDDWSQIKALGADHYRLFAKGSRIIVTTRRPELLDKLVVSDDDHPCYYETKRWNRKKSLELFCLHAYGKAEPSSGYLYNDVLEIASGSPVQLKMLGFILKGKPEEEWDGYLEEIRRSSLIASIHELRAKLSKYKKQNNVTGLWGGEDGEGWTYRPKGVIWAIRIKHDENGIHSIRFTNKGENGHDENSMQFGGTDSRNLTKEKLILKIDDKDMFEKLNGIRGTVGTYKGLQIVTSVSFTLNDGNTYGPYGEERGAYFSMIGDADQTIIGFHGRQSRWLNAIGVLLSPSPRKKKP